MSNTKICSVLDIERTLELDVVLERMKSQDFPDVEDFTSKFQLVFWIGRRDGDFINWVAEVDPELRHHQEGREAVT